MAVAAPRRRADRDEHRIGARDAAAPRSVVKESRPALTLEATSASSPGSKIGISPRSQRLDLRGVLVDAHDFVAEIRKAGPETSPT
jgi:hypothetical protein